MKLLFVSQNEQLLTQLMAAGLASFARHICSYGRMLISVHLLYCGTKLSKNLMLQIPGLVNVDFADVKAVMSNSGTAMLGVGMSTGKNRAEEAAQQATSAPLIERSIERATGVVYNITGGKDLTLQEVNRVSQVFFSTSSRAP